MPKKHTSENQKAAASKARREATKAIQEAKERQEKEDALWVEEDKKILRKQARKESILKKKQASFDRKMETKQLIIQEQEKIQSPKQSPLKITRAQIAIKSAPKELKRSTLSASPASVSLEKNTNRIGEYEETARTVAEAIKALNVSGHVEIDKNPEKRRKSAYVMFEERRLNELKTENPDLKLSQYKNIVFKEWQRCPDNPINKFGTL